MDLLLEIIADILLDGSLEIFTDKKMPMWLRIIAGSILAVVYGGLTVLGIILTVSGIRNADVALILLGLCLSGLMVAFAIMLYRKLRKRP